MNRRSPWSPSSFMTSRRELLKMLGAGAALAPFLPVLTASGEESAPRRLVLFFTPHGTVFKNWRPTRTDTGFELSRILKPLEPYKQKLVVIDGMGIRSDGPGAPHTKGPALLYTASPLLDNGTFAREDCSGGCSFGWNSGPSVDQVIAGRLGGQTLYKSLEFGVRTGGGHPGSHIIYKGPAQPVPARNDPKAAFDSLFGGVKVAEGDMNRLVRHRRAAFGLVDAELERLMPRLPSVDRGKIEAHRDAIEQLGRKLVQPVPVCAVPSRPGTPTDPEAPYIFERHCELLVAALSCDLTRIASLQVRKGENDGDAYPYVGVNVQHHLTTHNTSDQSQELITKIYEHYAGHFAYLLKLLDSVPEGSGTMLDHTMVIWGSELGVGSSHDFREVPFVVAGGGAFGVKSGQYLTTPKGTHHNRLLVSAMRFMGDPDVDTFGSTDQERGPLAGLGV